jgi:hypothetical protein
MPAARYGDLETSVRADLRAMRVQLAGSGLARSAVIVARRIDGGGLEPRELAALVGRLESVLATVAKANPPVMARDGIDDLAARRSARRAG